ncbi:MAG: Pr6Pr family membrane protein [Rhodobacteraceae bacterium]|nr:Pr6Pr family membrane protein [Paracoccaceae bacterium]
MSAYDGDRLGPVARSAALAVSVSAFGALAIRVVASLEQFEGDMGATLWHLAGFFTVLTNLLVAVHFMAIAAGWRVSGARVAGLVLWIGLVGLVYHLLLARLWSPEGLAWWADHSLHTLVPILVALWWLAFVPVWSPNWRVLLSWQGWPLAYVVYALLRGGLTGFWPYPFLDPGLNGAWGVAVNLLGLLVSFLLFGAALAFLDHLRLGSRR